jgi:peptidyl-dipeptidase A
MTSCQRRSRSNTVNRKAQLLSSLAPLSLVSLALLAPLASAASGCGGAQAPLAAPCPAAADVASGAPATAEEAKKFIEQVDKDLRRLWVARDRAGWVNQNFITDDTEALSASGEEATAAYVTEAITKAKRFDGVKGIDPDIARELLLLKLAQVVPAPSNADVSSPSSRAG